MVQTCGSFVSLYNLKFSGTVVESKLPFFGPWCVFNDGDSVETEG